MKEFRVTWTKCPTNYNERRVLFVEAENANDARVIVRDHIERKFGIEWIKIGEVTETEPVPAGKVKE